MKVPWSSSLQSDTWGQGLLQSGKLEFTLFLSSSHLVLHFCIHSFAHFLINTLIHLTPNFISLEHYVLDTVLCTENMVQSICAQNASIWLCELYYQENKLREYVARRLILQDSSSTDICKVMKTSVIHVNYVIFFCLDFISSGFSPIYM